MFPMFPQLLTVPTRASRAPVFPRFLYIISFTEFRGNIGNTEGIAETESETERKHRKHLGQFPPFFGAVGSPSLEPNPTKFPEDAPHPRRHCLGLVLEVDLQRVIHQLPTRISPRRL